MVTRSIGLFFLPAIIKFSPLFLITFSPFLHHLILGSTLIDPVLFLLTGSLTSILQCTIGFGFGHIHGLKGINWIISRDLIAESKIISTQKWIRLSAPLVLLSIPGPLVAMVAGVSKLSPVYFFIYMIPSQIIWISACYMLGMKLETYLKQINQWMMANWISITLSILLLKLLYQAVRYLKNKKAQL